MNTKVVIVYGGSGERVISGPARDTEINQRPHNDTLTLRTLPPIRSFDYNANPFSEHMTYDQISLDYHRIIYLYWNEESFDEINRRSFGSWNRFICYIPLPNDVDFQISPSIPDYEYLLTPYKEKDICINNEPDTDVSYINENLFEME